MKIFPISLLIEGLDVPVIGTGDLARAKARGVERAGGQPVFVDPASPELPAMHHPARLALVAFEGEGVEAWAARLKAAGFWVNVADVPDLCDFLLPAVVDRAPVMITIATGGASATLSRRLREAIEAMLPQSLGVLAEAISAARPAIARRLTTPGQRRDFWDRMLAGPLDPLHLEQVPAPEAIIAMADGALPLPRPMVLRLHSASPDDLTLRGQRLLQRADRILLLGDAAKAVARLARRDAVLVDLDSGVLPVLPPAEQIVLLLPVDTPLPAGFPSDHGEIFGGKAAL